MGKYLYTYWGLTINNPTENDFVLIRNHNEKYVRQTDWTLEKGETEHIQAYVRLHRNNTMTMMKKLYPRAHFTGLSTDEYELNMKNYATKEDVTTVGAHHHKTTAAKDAMSVYMEMCGDIAEDLKVVVSEQRIAVWTLDGASTHETNMKKRLEDWVRNKVRTKAWYEQAVVSDQFKALKKQAENTIWRLMYNIDAAPLQTPKEYPPLPPSPPPEEEDYEDGQSDDESG